MLLSATFATGFHHGWHKLPSELKDQIIYHFLESTLKWIQRPLADSELDKLPRDIVLLPSLNFSLHDANNNLRPSVHVYTYDLCTVGGLEASLLPTLEAIGESFGRERILEWLKKEKLKARRESEAEKVLKDNRPKHTKGNAIESDEVKLRRETVNMRHISAIMVYFIFWMAGPNCLKEAKALGRTIDERRA